jgi:hypothetical protein
VASDTARLTRVSPVHAATEDDVVFEISATVLCTRCRSVLQRYISLSDDSNYAILGIDHGDAPDLMFLHEALTFVHILSVAASNRPWDRQRRRLALGPAGPFPLLRGAHEWSGVVRVS